MSNTLTSKRLTRPRGMTIVELMVVIAIAAGLTGLSVYTVGALTASDLRDEAMRVTSAMKYTWTRAAVNGAQYRMVIDLDQNSYHTEVTDAPVVREAPNLGEEEGVLPEEAAEEERRRSAGASSNLFDDGESDPFGIHKAPTYEQVEDGAIKPHTFEEGVQVHQVHVAYQETPISSGKVAINFFPDGYQQPVIIVLSNGKDDYYSLVNEPLTGRVRLYSKEITDRTMLEHGEDDD